MTSRARGTPVKLIVKIFPRGGGQDEEKKTRSKESPGDRRVRRQKQKFLSTVLVELLLLKDHSWRRTFTNKPH